MERGHLMFKIDDDKTIYLTRGDIASIEVSAKNKDNEAYTFQEGDVLRMQVFDKGNCGNVVLRKEITVQKETQTVDISLSKTDTQICEHISKPKDFWYEIELNPYTAPQTIIGYDEEGAKIFRVFPEGSEQYE